LYREILFIGLSYSVLLFKKYFNFLGNPINSINTFFTVWQIAHRLPLLYAIMQ
jgi:hypothetical protein